MSHIERKQVEAAPTPANWHEVRVGGLTVYREDRQEVSHYEDQMVNRTNESGEVRYVDPDGTGSGFFAEGAQPDGWTAEQRTERVPVMRDARGAINSVQIVEEDADGNMIPRGKEGFSELAAFGSKEMRDLAMANADTVGIAYDTAVAALRNLAEAIYAAVK